MMKTERPLWGRGIMVSPQHFQQQAAYAAWTAEVIARMGLNHPWGVVEATFEPEMLKLGRLQAHRLQVRFQDGTMIDTDNADALPSALSLDGASGEAVIVLALPLMQANGGNCLKPEEVAERPARFRQRWRDVRNQFGDDTRQIAVIQPELTLRFAHQDNSDYLTCPLVRLQRDSQGAWLIDETFLPPLLQIQGSRWLATQLEQLLIQLRARLTRLMAMRRESNERMADFAVADVSLFWLLNALNSHASVLTEYERFPSRPPEQVWAELARLAGSMLTFSLDHDLDAIPGYDHKDPASVFFPLFDLITGLLDASLPSRVIALEMSRPDGQTWKASLHDIRLREEADLWLSVRSDIPAWQVAEKFPALCLAGSPDNVSEIYGAALRGIPLIPVSRVPAALPVRMENQYFALDMESPAAHEMLEQGVCMFYVPELLGALELELFAVLRS